MSDPATLLSQAEDHFLHGHLLVPWITDYVDLEESLAVGSMAQEELAHAATLMELAGLDLHGRDQFIFERPESAWAPTALLTYRLRDWPATVLRAYLLATAATVRSLLLSGSADPEWARAGEVLLAEQRLHVTHWQRWVLLLGQDGRTSAEFRARAREILPMAADVFAAPTGGPADEPAIAQAAHAAWVDSLTGPLSEVEISPVALGSSPQPRRRDEGSELTQILAEVRELRRGPDDGVRGLYR